MLRSICLRWRDQPTNQPVRWWFAMKQRRVLFRKTSNLIKHSSFLDRESRVTRLSVCINSCQTQFRPAAILGWVAASYRFLCAFMMEAGKVNSFGVDRWWAIFVSGLTKIASLDTLKMGLLSVCLEEDDVTLPYGCRICRGRDIAMRCYLPQPRIVLYRESTEKAEINPSPGYGTESRGIIKFQYTDGELETTILERHGCRSVIHVDPTKLTNLPF